MKHMTVKKWIGAVLKGLLIAVVLFFTATESINFFLFIFPAEQWYMAYTGFGLTIGAFVVYAYLFLNDADTSLKKTVALIMIIVGILGELLTAGYGMQIQAWKTAGWVMTESDANFMIIIVRIMIFVHAAALLFYSFGEQVIHAFDDDDGDGTPNIVDRRDNRKNSTRVENLPAPVALAAETKAEALDASPNASGGGK